MSEAELSWKFRLHLTQAAVVSTEELGLDYFLLILWGHGHYRVKPCGISQCTLMREGDCPAGPQLLPALVSALQGTGNTLSTPWRRGGPRPQGLAIKEGQRLRWDFKDLLVSISLLHSSWILLVGSFPEVCNKAFPWRLKIQKLDYFTEFSRECACLTSKWKGCCWGRYWSPWNPGRALPALNDIGSRLLWPTSPKQKWLNGLKHRGIISEMREKEQFQPVTLWGWYLIYAKACCLIQRDHCEKGGKVVTIFVHDFFY